MNKLCGIALFLLVSNVVFAQDANRPSQPDLPGDLLVDFGFNLWDSDISELPISTWGSNSFGIYYNKRFRFSDHVSFYGALGVTWDKYAFENNVTWLRAGDGTVGLDSLDEDATIRKNKLVATYLDVPVEFRIHPLGTVNGEGWFIGLGAIGGLKIGNNTKLKYDIGDETQKEKTYADFGLETFRYGLQFRFGFKSFHLFYKTYLNDTFSTSPDSDVNPRTSTIGINFSGF